MKKTLLTVAIATIAQFSYAQFSIGGNPTTTMDNVGIGTASPVGKLEIKGTNAGSYFDSSYANTLNGESGTNTDIGLLGFNFVGYNGGATRFRDLYIYNGKQVAITMFQGSTGNVGIGTTSPGALLDLDHSGNTALDLRITNSGVNGARMDFNSTLPGHMQNFRVGTNFINNTGEFGIYDITNNATRFFIAPNGFVGIGTPTPQEALSVNGNIRSKQVKVETNNWPDYVFNPNYSLPSLSEVKTYIDKYQHLPDMPSEADVAKDGLNLGEINKLLTKKVEELTLYLIEQDKQLKVLKRQVEAIANSQTKN